MRALAELGFRYFPLSHTGVPEIVKESKPVGLESELRALLDVTEYFLNTNLNENLLVVVVGEYGWGKTELLDYYTTIIKSRYRDRVEIARIPLTFELSVRHVRSILERRGSKPLILIVDEADELSRVFSLARNKTEDLTKVVTELATTIRAILEPRQYSSVIELPLSKLNRILLIVAVTPHLYFEILKSSVPDIFDITIGRVYREIIIRSEIPLWLYHAIIIEKLRAASTRERINEIAKGRLDAVYPLRFEYLASLYYILYIQERGHPSPRALIKFTAELLDRVLSKGRINIEVFVDFLKSLAREVEIASKLLEKVSQVKELHSDELTRRVRLLLELSPIPLSEDTIENEVGKRARSILRSLLETGIVEEVAIVRTNPEDRELLRKLSEVRVQLGYPDIPISDDLRKLSIEIDSYYTKFEERPVLYVILPLQAASQLGVSYIRAYKLRERIVLKLDESSPELKILDLVRYAYSLPSRPRELAKILAEALLREARINIQLSENTFALCSGSGLEVRKCLIFSYIHGDQDLENLLSKLTDIARNGYVESASGLVPFDVLLVVVFAPSINIPRERIEDSIKEWKAPGLDPNKFLKVVVFDSGKTHDLRQIIAGYLIERSGLAPPQRFTHLVRAYRELARDVEAFLNEARRAVLADLCLSIRKGRETKHQVLRRIVRAWINREKLIDQPEVFRGSDGTPIITKPERLFLEYLRSRGISRLSQKEAEHVVRVLFPVHLWREIRDRDFIELCRLRGLLLLEGNHYLVYSPDTAREHIMRRLKTLRDMYSKLCREVEIDLGEKLKVRICEKLGEDLSILRSLESRVTSLVSLGYDDDSLRIVSAIIQDIEELEARFSSQAKTLAEYENKLKAITASLQEILRQIEQKLDEIKSLKLGKIAEALQNKITRELSLIKDILLTYENLAADQLYEIMSKLADQLNASIVTIDLLKNTASQILDLERACSKYGHVKFGRLVLEDVNIMASLRQIDIDSIVSLLESVKRLLTGAVSDFLSKAHEEESKMKTFVEWVCNSKKTLTITDICSSASESTDLSTLRKTYTSLVDLLKRKLSLDENSLVKLALLRGRVVTAEDLAKELNVEVNHATAILNKLCDLGLAKRAYLIE